MGPGNRGHRRLRRLVLHLIAASLLTGAVAAGAATHATARKAAIVAAPSTRLQTAILDQAALSTEPVASVARVPQTGATAIRLVLNWERVAPKNVTATFVATDPTDEHYDWTYFDDQVKLAVEHELLPLVTIQGAPDWARGRPSAGGPYKPSPAKLAAFATAAARRYDGTQEDLPRVRYWQLWNEPNLAVNLRPQLIGKRVYSAYWYRLMLNAFASAVHKVDPANSVIAGGTAPFTSRAGAKSSWGPGPLLFMRELLCLSKQLEPTCKQRATFDIWAHHPYTSGGPTHRANIRDDVSLGDLPAMRAVLNAGIRTGHVVSRRPIRFWVTEFSWDTNPPDPNAMPIALQARWVSEALYTMATSGISLVTWFLIRDENRPSPYQSGLFFHGGRAKPTLQAFRFPFVAFAGKGRIEFWGRTPPGTSRGIVIERRTSDGWARLAGTNANAGGVFRGAVASNAVRGMVRARLTGSSTEASRPFSLTRPPDRFYRPFGEARR